MQQHIWILERKYLTIKRIAAHSRSIVAEEAPVGIGLSSKVILESATPNIADNRVPFDLPAAIPSLVKVDAAQDTGYLDSCCVPQVHNDGGNVMVRR